MTRSSLLVLSRRRLAQFLQISPWLTAQLVGVIRRTRARFTVGVVGVVVNEAQQLLVVEHVFHPDHPWGLPGGWLERHEDPATGLKRELQEELDLTVTVVESLLVERSKLAPAHLDIAYLCLTDNEVGKLSHELMDYKWVNVGELPILNPFQQAAVKAAKKIFV